VTDQAWVINSKSEVVMTANMSAVRPEPLGLTLAAYNMWEEFKNKR
jgi:hypothetical protein